MTIQELALLFIPLNIFGIFLIYKLNSRSKIKQLKNSKLNTIIIKVLDDFKNHIKLEYLPDKRIKVLFPTKVAEENLYFYLHETIEGKIVISEYGEIVSRIDMGKTPNKNAIKKACATFGVEYIPKARAIELTVDPSQLDESIWAMYSALLVIEYVRY